VYVLVKLFKMQYFKNRTQAGYELSKQLTRYRDSLTVIVSLSESGISVATAIAEKLHLPVGLLATKEVRLPWREAPIVGSVDNTGRYNRNEALGKAFLEEFEIEYHNYIDQEKIRAIHEINMMHVSNVMTYSHLKDKAIIITSDGLNDVRPINETINYLKPVRITRLIAALPVATIGVIDKLHVAVDEIHCLDVKNNYVSTDHYYENEDEIEYDQKLSALLTHGDK
jgi:putative phosphoribosyl transferase